MVTVLIATAIFAGDGVQMKFVPEGATARTGGYSPIRAEFSATPPAGLKKGPVGFGTPLYGVMKFGTASVSFAVDDSDPTKIAVDSNHDGDFTNDEKAEWNGVKRGDFTMYTGGTKADIGRGTPVKLSFYRFDPKDPSRAPLKSTLLYYGDFGYDVTVTLGGKDYKSFVSGEPGPNTRLSIDRDGNGKPSFFYEAVQVGKPFNFTGTTYVLNAADGKLTLDKSSETLPQAPMPPVLEVGKKVLTFDATTMDGTKISFPSSYKGKIVMIDFWATWCGPCMAEVPNVVKAYEQFHDKGFEVLGISFDQANAVEKINTCTATNKMPWKQVYEGKFWDTTIGHQFDVASIPFCLLVDGDTGEILATSGSMRGPNLIPTLEKALAKKHGN